MDKSAITDKNFIPPITDPLGKHWEQPDRARILIDDTHAVMSQDDFEKLLDYTASQPTGTYVGKMWRAQYGKPGSRKWYLCWFGKDPDPKFLSNNYREILIA